MKLIIGGAKPLGKADLVLIRSIARARAWLEELTSGVTPSVEAIAKRKGVIGSYVTQMIKQLAFLSTVIVRAILAGRQPPELTTDRLIKNIEVPMDWNEQKIALGFEHR